MTQPMLKLKRKADRRLRAGHLWIYSNEVDTVNRPLTAFAAGDCVQVVSSEVKSLGNAYLNRLSLLWARLYSLLPNQPLNSDFLAAQIARALALREQLFSEPFYRLVYGESDGLPGLVVDRFDQLLVVQ